jgi:hypothetical protein
MPCRVTSPMYQRQRFVLDAERGTRLVAHRAGLMWLGEWRRAPRCLRIALGALAAH